MSVHLLGLDDTHEVTRKIHHRCFLVARLKQLRCVLRRRVTVLIHFPPLILCLNKTNTGILGRGAGVY